MKSLFISSVLLASLTHARPVHDGLARRQEMVYMRPATNVGSSNGIDYSDDAYTVKAADGIDSNTTPEDSTDVDSEIEDGNQTSQPVDGVTNQDSNQSTCSDTPQEGSDDYTNQVALGCDVQISENGTEDISVVQEATSDQNDVIDSWETEDQTPDASVIQANENSGDQSSNTQDQSANEEPATDKDSWDQSAATQDQSADEEPSANEDTWDQSAATQDQSADEEPITDEDTWDQATSDEENSSPDTSMNQPPTESSGQEIKGSTDESTDSADETNEDDRYQTEATPDAPEDIAFEPNSEVNSSGPGNVDTSDEETPAAPETNAAHTETSPVDSASVEEPAASEGSSGPATSAQVGYKRPAITQKTSEAKPITSEGASDKTISSETRTITSGGEVNAVFLNEPKPIALQEVGYKRPTPIPSLSSKVVNQQTSPSASQTTAVSESTPISTDGSADMDNRRAAPISTEGTVKVGYKRPTTAVMENSYVARAAPVPSEGSVKVGYKRPTSAAPEMVAGSSPGSETPTNVGYKRPS
ncbi:hypothetical protein DSO57_1031358 [Entomophthora muscae]|uniref:Uncharacterized protein n=1 Tax=Entomophthora muscae TaxID=34485 RepID=A0ACC2TMX6_9FUNG|nr:hypothetical protein DSO57_1031358 [Entomophthora muscae]